MEKGREMNALTRRDPFEEMAHLQPCLERVRERAPTSSFTPGRELLEATLVMPAVDIGKGEQRCRLEIYFPEPKAEEVKVTILRRLRRNR